MYKVNWTLNNGREREEIIEDIKVLEDLLDALREEKIEYKLERI